MHDSRQKDGVSGRVYAVQDDALRKQNSTARIDLGGDHQ